MADYLIFNITSIILFAVCLISLVLDIFFKKWFLKILEGLLITSFVIASILLGATYQELLIAILILLIIALFVYYPRKKDEIV